MAPKTSSRKKTTPTRKRSTKTYVPDETRNLAHLVADPCNAPLTAPQYGGSDSGYVIRLSGYESLETGSNGTNGYLLWFPDYSGRIAGTDRGGNLFIFGANSASTAPNNTTASPLGRGTSYTAANGTFVSDPATAFVRDPIVRDARTAGACIKMLYTGRNDALSGRIAYLSNVPREVLAATPTAADLFRYSNQTVRTPMDYLEQKFRAGDGSAHFRSLDDETDWAFSQGSIGSSVTDVGTGSPGGVGMGIGFAWTGLHSNQSIAFDFLKVIEWRPDVASGIVALPASVSDKGGNLMSRALAYLDKHAPGWERRALSFAKSAASKIANIAFSGPGNQFVKALPLLL